MPYDSSGIYSLPPGYLATTGQTILASQHNPPFEDVASSLSQVLLRSGVAPMNANLNMNGFRITGLSDGVNPTDAVALGQALLAQGAPWTTESTVASAATCDILGAQSNFIHISGTTTITSLGTGANRFRIVRFSGILTLTHNATSLILPGAANITTAAGDTMLVVSSNTSNARVVVYQRANGTALVMPADLALNSLTIGGVPVYPHMPFFEHSAAYTLVLSDGQTMHQHPGTDDNPRTFQIPPNSSVPFPLGTAVSFSNRANTLLIAPGSGVTLELAGTSTQGNRTLAVRGIATAVKLGTNFWSISGVGLT